MKKTILYSKILVVDDEVQVCESLRQVLQEEKFEVETANDGEQALAMLDEFEPHCVLLDIRMPYLSGVDALKLIKLRQPDIEVIMVTAVSTLKIAEECMRNGAFGYIPKPVDLDYLLKEVRAALAHREKAIEKHRLQSRESLVHEGAIQLLNYELVAALKSPFDLIEFIYPEFGCHSKNVAWLSKALAEKMGLLLIRLCELAGLYHDIGQLCLPGSLQKKPQEKISFREMRIFEKFPLYGQNFVESHFHLKGLGNVIKHQCENMDGTGFPGLLAGDDIPIESRVVAVASAFDEELRNVGLRNIEQDLFMGRKVLNAITSQVNKKFDPVVVSALDSMTMEHKYKATKEVKMGINNLQTKMILSRDVITENGNLVLARQTTLTPLLLGKIMDLVSMRVGLLPIYVYTEPFAQTSGK